ncbi:hypothetical protein JT306_00940 [Salmonella enterica subsp. enterica serovar Kentucky]|nr:hypothetical protein [Salmonella enterica subsp. enterica serovar Kentucky]UJL40309.1 hypothetical protein JRY29_06080 [Salmonella enterica subsp. enterica serovar Kentucky]
MGIDDELSRLFVIVKALCRTLDLLSVPTCQVPYFYIKGKDNNFQICISTEEELKMWLRKYIILSESLFSAVNLSGKYSLFNMKNTHFKGLNYSLHLVKEILQTIIEELTGIVQLMCLKIRISYSHLFKY